MKPSLSSVRIAGLTSIEDLTLDLTTSVTVLIGPNGAGKSNLVGALELLGRIIDGQLEATVVRRGGFASLLHRSTTPDRNARKISIEVWGEPEGQVANGYEAVLEELRGDLAGVTETLYIHDRSKYAQPYGRVLSLFPESRLRETARAADWQTAGIAKHVRPIIAGCRVFHFQDTSSDAPVKQRVLASDRLSR